MNLLSLIQGLATTTALVVALGASVASAATLDFDGSPDEAAFVLTDAQIVNGPCNSPSGKPCIALNNNSSTTISAQGDAEFSASSFFFEFLGEGTNNTLFVTSSSGSIVELDAETFDTNDGGQEFSLAGLGFDDITFLTFTSSEGGNVRIDDIMLTVAAVVPLPASGLLLLGPFAMLLIAGRRRRTV